MVNLSSKEADTIADNPFESNTSHRSIWILGIDHCSASKVVNVASNDQNFQASAVSVDHSIDKSCQASFGSSITGIGLVLALVIVYVTNIGFRSPAFVVSHAIANNSRIGLSTASILRKKSPAIFDSHDMNLGPIA